MAIGLPMRLILPVTSFPTFKEKERGNFDCLWAFKKKRYKRALTNQWCDMYGGKDGFYWTLKKKTDNTVTAWEMLRGA